MTPGGVVRCHYFRKPHDVQNLSWKKIMLPVFVFLYLSVTFVLPNDDEHVHISCTGENDVISSKGNSIQDGTGVSRRTYANILERYV